MKDFKDISKIFSIARANDIEIEFNKSKCGGFQIVSDIGEEKVELNSKDILGVESSEQVTIGEFKNFLDLLDLDENMPIKLTFYNHSGNISESGLLQGVSVSQNGTLELITMRWGVFNGLQIFEVWNRWFKGVWVMYDWQ